MGKEKFTDKTKRRNYESLRADKNKAKAKNDYKKVAEYSNYIGELLAQEGFFEEAIKEHREEIHFSEISNNMIDVAVGNRKVGECLTELGEFEEALHHQQTHLKIAKSLNNSLEQQRALATIGRTHFREAEHLSSEETDAVNASLMKAQEAYLKSLDLCNSLTDEVSAKEKLEMRARLYLNLGLVYEQRMSFKEAMRFVSKALVISKEQKLNDDVFRCHHTQSGLYLSTGNMDKALQSSKLALTIARREGKKMDEMDSLAHMGLVLLRLGDFGAALNTLKQVYKHTQQSGGVDPSVVSGLKTAMKGVVLLESLPTCEDKSQLLTLNEKLGDLYSELKEPEKALEYYLHQLQIAESLQLAGKSLASIYVSIAVTYGDCKQHDKSLEYYYKELNAKHGELADKSSSYCAIAVCLENLSRPFEEIKECYMKALECAQGSGNHGAEMRVYRDWSATLRCLDKHEELINAEAKMKQIMEEYNISESVEDSEEVDSQDIDSSQTFTDKQLLMLQSDDEGDEDQEERHLGADSNVRKSSRQVKNKTVNKVNAVGETPLHVAAIRGDTEKVLKLLQQGASVSVRDACGWSPLHEACNHGNKEIVEHLLKYGADINDPGGQRCSKITPLHDAAQAGHIEVVKVLVSAGADTTLRTDDGYTPLEIVQVQIGENEEEFSTNPDIAEFLQRCKKVEEFLLSVPDQIGKKCEPAADRNRKILDALGDDDEEDEDDDDLLFQQQCKKKKLDLSSPSRDLVTSSPCPVRPSIRGNILDDFNSSGVTDAPSSCGDQISDFEDDGNSFLNIEGQQSKKSISKKSSSDVPGDLEFGITASTSSTSLLPAGGSSNLKDFIIDDMAPTKRKRQCKINYPIQLEFVEDRNTSTTSLNTTSKAKKKRSLTSKNLRQKRIEGFIDHSDTDSNDSVSSVIPPLEDIRDRNTTSELPVPIRNVPTSNQHPRCSSTNQSKSLFRIKIRINQQLFLIPCPEASEKDVAWLVSEAKQRYQSLCGVSTKLSLKTRDGALLNPSDKIDAVIMNDEEIIAEVVGLDLPPLGERYKSLCAEKSLVPSKEIVRQLEQNLSELQLSNMFITNASLAVVFSSVSCCMTLSSLDISGTFIGDQGFTQVVKCLQSLPSITVIKLGCIGITTKSVKELSNIVNSIRDEYKVIMREPPLINLSSLHLNNNDFQEHGLFAVSMAKIISHCTNLKQINLHSCRLANKIFDYTSPLRAALQSSCVSSVNISDNKMEDSQFITNIFSSLNHECVTAIDLSRTICLEADAGFDMTSIWRSLANMAKLKEVSLNGLPNRISENFSNTAIERLNLQYQDHDTESVAALCRQCLQFKHLVHLDLSFSNSVDNSMFELLLEQLQHSTLKTLLLVCSALHSPFSSEVFQLFGDLNKGGLSSLDMSYNDIEPDDKGRLSQLWTGLHGKYSISNIERGKCHFHIKN